MDQLIVLKYFGELVDLDVADPINDHCVFVLVLAADCVLVDVFDLIDPGCIEVVLCVEVRTWYLCLNCRKANSSWLRLALLKR